MTIETERQDGLQAPGDVEPNEQPDDPFEEWERYPATEAEENIEYQKIAWYAAPFGDAGFALLMLAATLNVLRRGARMVVRLLVH